jgi:hypothetical protein
MLTRVVVSKLHTSLTSFYVPFGNRTQIYIDIIVWIDYCPLMQGPITTPLQRMPTPASCVKTLYSYPDNFDKGTNPARNVIYSYTLTEPNSKYASVYAAGLLLT